jgi:hypothetical protein
MTSLTRLLHKAKFEIRSIIARKPALSVLQRPFIWWQQYKILRYYQDKGASIQECTVGSHTDLVIDGFQGSANSFAADAFLASQTRPVMVAHHMHSPNQIIKAVRREIPTLVTIRDPAGACLSLTCRWPYVSMQQALRSYVGFYSALKPHVRQLVLSPFQLTTKHLDASITAVNERFGTDFDLTDPVAIERMKAEHGPNKRSKQEERERDALKAKKSQELETPSCWQVLQEAEALHRSLEPYCATLGTQQA